ncbi:MAG TPA: 5'-3' exonuclease H3TH domain-containing protein, partial [Ktedonobacterales bacterium]|nr:5'-3' exonuclease H3TH domain-containing protein [Ktedonobacterales bacterium]
GVRPQSIPDWLGLVGDAADGFPGIPGWGAKSASAVLATYERLEAIPADPLTWGLAAISASRATRLAESLTQHWAEALLFRKLATLREDVPLQETLADLEWQGAHERLKDICHQLGDEKFPGRVPRWRTS